MLEKLMEESLRINLLRVGEQTTTVDGIYLKSISNKYIAFAKKMNYISISNPHMDGDDSLQEVAITIVKAFENSGLTEEEFTELFLGSFEEDDEKCSDAKSLYKYIEKMNIQRLSMLNKRTQKLAGEAIHKVYPKVTNFSDLAYDEELIEEEIERIIGKASFNNNDLFLHNKITDNRLLSWIEGNRKVFSKGELNYILNPSNVTSKSRYKFQKNIEKKIENKALEEFGTSNGKLIKMLMEKKLIESIVDAEEIQKEICNNIEYISENVSGYYDLDINILRDINKGITDSSHQAQDKSLVVICNLLFNKLDNLEEALKHHKVNSKNVEKEIVNRTSFSMKNIPNIVLEFENYPRIKKSGKGYTPAYQRFIAIHKKCWNGKCTVGSEFYDWEKYAKWVEDNSISRKETYLVYFKDKENHYSFDNCLLLPDKIQMLMVNTKPTYLKAEKVYVAYIRFNKKCYNLAYNRPVEELQTIINEFKTEKLEELIEIYKDSITKEAYEFLKTFKFDVR